MNRKVHLLLLTPIVGLLMAWGVPRSLQIVRANNNVPYYFLPGHPMFFAGPGSGSYCTGGYAIRGQSGMFLLTDGHCAGVGTTVYGTSRAFGHVSYTKYPAYDTEIVSETPPDDAYQTVVDPLTGRYPGGSGKVVGYLDESYFTNGFLVGKMGETTGWTEGQIYGKIWWPKGTQNEVAYCSHAHTWAGDSGGPVWRTAPGGGVDALGITVAYYPNTGDGCFLPIKHLLNLWGAWLPVWSNPNNSISASHAANTTSPGLPFLNPAGLKPAVGTVG
jgi:hypothetical protein